MSLSVICEILGLFFNTLTANGRYYLRRSENLPQSIKMRLSKKQNIFSQSFAKLLTFTSNFAHFKKTMTLTSLLMYFGNLELQKTWLVKFLKSPISENPSKINMLQGPKPLLKSAWQYFYQTFSTFSETFTCKMTLLLISETLELHSNTLTVNDKYFLPYCGKLQQPLKELYLKYLLNC